MKTKLDEIIEVKKEEVKTLRKDTSLSRFLDSEFYEKERLSISDSIRNDKNVSIIAEIKKASPSKGIIREDFDHLKIADIYMDNEVNAISVLTDVNFFKGSISYLNEIAKIKSVPLLRKDFIIDEYQVFEAKSIGADVILLICEALSENQIKELTHAAYEADLEALLELHSEEQLHKIDFSLNKLIGINNRNLSDFKVSLDTTLQLSKLIPGDVLFVSESGLNTKSDIEVIKSVNTNAVLIGEHFMRADNIDDSVKEMKEWCSNEN